MLLAAYVSGAQMCSPAGGMFAFAIWDEPNKSLLLARDRMGQKPLYVAGRRGSSEAVAFASEIRPLVPIAMGEREMIRDGV